MDSREEKDSGTNIGATRKTSDYSVFKLMDGNREIKKTNVNALVRSMTEYGNLTQNVPVLVNEHMEVVDGQHRLAALKILEWPVYYRVEEGLGLSVVRALNNTGSNWGWRDYASSYAPHKLDYQRFLELADKYEFGYSVLSTYAEVPLGRRSKSEAFNTGEFKFRDYENTCKLLQQAYDISQILGFKHAKFMRVLYKVMTNPDVDYQRLLHKVELNGVQIIKPVLDEAEYFREIEDCYNFKSTEENRQRLF